MQYVTTATMQQACEIGLREFQERKSLSGRFIAGPEEIVDSQRRDDQPGSLQQERVATLSSAGRLPSFMLRMAIAVHLEWIECTTTIQNGPYNGFSAHPVSCDDSWPRKTRIHRFVASSRMALGPVFSKNGVYARSRSSNRANATRIIAVA